MTIDTSRPVEIEASLTKLFGLAAAGVLMTALSAALAFRAFPQIAPGSFAEFIGYVGAVFFAACTVVAVWRALTAHGPVVTISREGFRDSRLATDQIPWSAIKSIATWQHRRQRMMVLTIDPAAEAKLKLTRLARWSLTSGRAVGVNGLCVNAADLKIGFDELLATTQAYAQTWHATPGPTARSH